MTKKVAKNPKKGVVQSKGDFITSAKKQLSTERLLSAVSKANLEIINHRLAELRERQGILQTEVRGFTQSSVSRIETRDDIKLSTLLQYINSIGMVLEIKVRAKDTKEEYSLIDTAKAS